MQSPARTVSPESAPTPRQATWRPQLAVLGVGTRPQTWKGTSKYPAIGIPEVGRSSPRCVISPRLEQRATILAFGAAPGMGMYPAGGGGRLGDAGPGGGMGLRRRRLHPGVVLDVLLELGHEFRGEGAPGLADAVHDVGRGRFFGAALEHDALEYMLRGPARGELDVGRGE
jgi:hypothetical protein